MNSTINICLIGEVSVGKTTLLSILLNNICGQIKRSRSTLNYSCFTENFSTTDFPFVENNNIFSNNIAHYDIPKLQWLNNDNRHYKISLYDTIGFNDIEIDEQNQNIYTKIKNNIDIIIIVLDVTKGLSTKSEKNILNMIDNNKLKIFVINKCDDTDDVELLDNFKYMCDYLIDNKYVSSVSDIISMSSDNIFNIIFKSNIKKSNFLLSTYDNENNIKNIFGYNNLINSINDKINKNLKTIFDEKINQYMNKCTNIYDFYKTIINASIINNTIYDIDDLIKNIKLTDNNNNNNTLYDDICYCIEKFNDETIKNLIDNYYKNNNHLNLIDLCALFDLTFKTEYITTVKYFIVLLIENIYFLNIEELINNCNICTQLIKKYFVIFPELINDNTITCTVNYLIQKIFVFLYDSICINYKKVNNNDIYLLYLNLVFFCKNNIKLCVFFNNLEKISLLIPDNYHTKYINNVTKSLKNNIICYNKINHFTDFLLLFYNCEPKEITQLVLDESVLLISNEPIQSSQPNLVTYAQTNLEVKKEEWICQFLKDGFAIFPCNINKTPGIKKWNNLTIEKSIELYTKIDFDAKDNSNHNNHNNHDDYTGNTYDKIIKQNIGIVCGVASNIVVIDIDNSDNGMQYWLELTNEFNEPQTLKTITGSGGLHYYFQYSDLMKKWYTRNKIFSTDDHQVGIDFRTNNGYIIMPPSIHPDTGVRYKFFDIEFDCVTSVRNKISEMPEWLFDKCNNFFENVNNHEIKSLHNNVYNDDNDNNDNNILKFGGQHILAQEEIKKIREQLHSLNSNLKKLESAYNFDIKTTIKNSKKITRIGKTGFAKAKPVPDKLAKFIGVAPGIELTSPEVTKKVWYQLKERGLCYIGDNRVFRVNSEVSKLFNVPITVNKSTNHRDITGFNFYNMQKYIVNAYK